ncbi:MAG: hypothetical protein WCI31_15625 [Prolixibacteraceae bacterium]
MRLQVNLIPAIAYALVNLFFNIAEPTSEVQHPAKKQQLVSSQAEHQKIDNHNRYFMLAKNGQVILSRGFENAGIVWKIPYTF